MRICGIPSYPGFYFFSKISREFPEGVDEVGMYIVCMEAY